MGLFKNENDQREREGCFGVMSVELGLEGKRIYLLLCGINYIGFVFVEDYFKIKVVGQLVL